MIIDILLVLTGVTAVVISCRYQRRAMNAVRGRPDILALLLAESVATTVAIGTAAIIAWRLS